MTSKKHKCPKCGHVAKLTDPQKPKSNDMDRAIRKSVNKGRTGWGAAGAGAGVHSSPTSITPIAGTDHGTRNTYFN